MKARRGLFATLVCVLVLALMGCGGGGDGGKPKPKTPPDAPTGVMANSPTSGEVIVTWTAAARATTHNLYYSTTTGVTQATGTQILDVTSPFLHTGLTDGQQVYYVVTGANSKGESPDSNEGTAFPMPAPTGLLATSGDTEVTLDWTPVAGAVAYNLFWANSTGVTTSDTAIPGVTPPYTHTGLSNGTNYYYVVTALNAVGGGGESAASAEAFARPIGAPTGVTVTGDSNGAYISWNPVTGATSYNIYWLNATGVNKSNGNRITGVSSPYFHAGLTNSTPYYYIVTAVNLTGEGGESAEGWTVPIAAPTGIDALEDTGQVTLTWSLVPGATSYNIYWANTPGVTKFSPNVIAGANPAGELHAPLANNTSYYYVVTALNTQGGGAESAVSVEVVGTPNLYGMRDTAFDGRGWISDDGAAGAGGDDFGWDVATDGVGRIVVAGWATGPSLTLDLALWRYNADGTIDTTFGGTGVVTHHDAGGGATDDVGQAVIVAGSGDIYVAGYSDNAFGDKDLVIWRYQTTGVLDNGFDTDGWVTHGGAAGGGGHDFAYDLALDTSGRLVVCGSGWNNDPNPSLDMVVWRWNTNGNLDATFGPNNDGIFSHGGAAGGPGGPNDEGLALTIDASDRIVVTGRSENGPDYDMVVWRLLADGTLDGTFGTGGFLVSDGAAGGVGDDEGSAVTHDGAGNILVAGNGIGTTGNYDIIVWRYDSAGTLDPTFGTAGVIIEDGVTGGGADEFAQAITWNALGWVAVGGFSWNQTFDSVILRYDAAAGGRDPTFGANGLVSHNNAAGGNGDDYLYGMTTDTSDRVIAAGFSDNGADFDMVVWRYR